MTLDEAIKHAEEVAEEIENEAVHYEIKGVNCCNIHNCAAEHRQLAKWLKDYKKLLEQEKWIPISERLPAEQEWIGTEEFGTTISDEVYVTFESPQGERFIKHISFQNGKVSNFVQNEINVFHKGAVPIAWMPLPEPYNAERGGEE